MKISEMIANLQNFMNEHGDLDCWYAKDDEGNGFHPVSYNPSLFYTNENDRELLTFEDLGWMEEDPNDYIKVCVVN